MEIDDAREAECVVCGEWPAALRPAMRNAIDSVPLRKPLCEACVEAFAHNCIELWLNPPEPPEQKG
jgi:hypothetical protein